jgi:Tfp pilus assembly protein PilO
MVTHRNNRQKLLAIITAATIICAVIFMAIIEPQLSRRRVLLEHMHDLELKLTRMEADLLVRDRIDDIYSRVEPLIASRGTEHQEQSLLIRQLGELYGKLDVKIRSVVPLLTANEEFYSRLTVKIEMSGQIRSILNFISAVETHPNPIRIEKFDLKTKDAVDHVQASFLITKVVAKAEPEAD